MTSVELLKRRLLKKLAETFNGEKVDVVMTASVKDVYVTVMRPKRKAIMAVRLDPKILTHSTKNALNHIWSELFRRGAAFFENGA